MVFREGNRRWVTIQPSVYASAHDQDSSAGKLEVVKQVTIRLGADDDLAAQTVASLINYAIPGDQIGSQPFANVIDKVIDQAFHLGQTVGRIDAH